MRATHQLVMQFHRSPEKEAEYLTLQEEYFRLQDTFCKLVDSASDAVLEAYGTPLAIALLNKRRKV